MKSRGLVVAGVALAGVAAVVSIYLARSGDQPASSPPPSAAKPTVAEGSAVARPSARVRQLSPEDRRVFAERIAAAQAKRASHGATTGSAPASPEQAAHDAQYVQTFVTHAMSEARPLLDACYQKALPTLEKPDFGVKSMLKLTGDPDVGTLIDAAALKYADGRPLPAELDDCLRSTLQSLELPPLEEGTEFRAQFMFGFGTRPKP